MPPTSILGSWRATPPLGVLTFQSDSSFPEPQKEHSNNRSSLPACALRSDPQPQRSGTCVNDRHTTFLPRPHHSRFPAQPPHPIPVTTRTIPPFCAIAISNSVRVNASRLSLSSPNPPTSSSHNVVSLRKVQEEPARRSLSDAGHRLVAWPRFANAHYQWPRRPQRRHGTEGYRRKSNA